MRLSTKGDNDTTRRELAEMDRFLDGHPEVAEQLRKDPSLINNQEFVESIRSCGSFLQNHPESARSSERTRNAFMRRKIATNGTRAMIVIVTETAIVGWRHKPQRPGKYGPFLDGHPEIAEQLRKDPSLINNREFVENHPALQQYLQSHPEVREEFKENPSAFMRQENRYERHEVMIVTVAVEIATRLAENWRAWTGSWTAIRRSRNSCEKILR